MLFLSLNNLILICGNVLTMLTDYLGHKAGPDIGMR